MKSLIAIAVFDIPVDAQLCKSKLEAEGIECFLENESLVAAQPLLSQAVGGVVVRVKEGDVERAKAIV